MAISKVIFNGDTLMDVTGDNPASDNMLTGTKATGANGQSVNGALVTAPASDTDPVMDGTASAGSASTYSRGDHVHPSDTSKLGTSGNASSTTVTFTQASSRTNISSGGTLATAFGRISKWFADLGSLAFKSTVAKSDLESSVQTSLGKADTALQSYTETDPTVPSWAKASSKPSYTANEVGAVGTSGDASSTTVTFTQAGSRTNISSGGTIATAFSRISKWLSDLGSLAFKSTVSKSDLESSVQTSLGKADTALQSYTETDPTVPSWAKQSTKPSYTASEVGALPDTTTIPTASTTNPSMDGTASYGSGTSYARSNHVHPTDTSRQAKITANGLLKGDGSGGVTVAVAGTDYIASHQDISGKLDKSGGTMTGSLVLASDPTADLQAATKKYVDSAVDDSGINPLKYYWNRKSYSYELSIHDYSVTGITKRLRFGQYYSGSTTSNKAIITWDVSKNITINHVTGEISLVNPTRITLGQTANDDISSLTAGTYFKYVSHTGSADTTVLSYTDRIWYIRQDMYADSTTSNGYTYYQISGWTSDVDNPQYFTNSYDSEPVYDTDEIFVSSSVSNTYPQNTDYVIDTTLYPYVYKYLGPGSNLMGTVCETGTYTGAGSYGSSNANSITFNRTPIFVWITGGSAGSTPSTGAVDAMFNCVGLTSSYASRKYMVAPGFGASSGAGLDSTSNMYAKLDGTTLSWYYSNSSNGPAKQMNTSSTTYTYFAICQ